MPGRVWDQIYEIAVDQHGFVTSEQVSDLGIDRMRLVEMAHRGHLERVAQGVYRMGKVPIDRLTEAMQATLWARGHGVISHRFALDLYDVCDVNPAWVDITVPLDYRERRTVPGTYRLHRRQLLPEEISRMEGVPVVSPFRAITDCIKSAIGEELIDQAMTNARRDNLITEPQQVELVGLRALMRRHGSLAFAEYGKR